MPNTIIRPVSQGIYNNWPLAAGATKPSALADQNDGSWVDGSQWGHSGDQSAQDADSPKDSYILAAPSPALTGKIIDSFGVLIRARGFYEPPETGDNVNTYKVFVRLGGVEVISTSLGGIPTGAFGILVSVLSRPGGGPWTVADFAAIEVGFNMSYHRTTHIPDNQAVSEVWGNILWHEPTGSSRGMIVGGAL